MSINNQILKPLYDAVRATGLNWTEFCREYDIPIDRSNLRKKLQGDITMSLDDVEIVADAVGIEFVARPKRRRAA